MNKLTVKDIDVRGKRVLVRVDFNVPLDKATGSISDDSRIRATLPTIKYLIEQDARIILISHLGRPKGKVVDALRMTPVAQRLSQILGHQVGVAANCIGPEVETSVETLRARDVLLLENLRFHSDEETGSAEFARALSRLGDIFVNDAFGTSHRAHASIAGIANFLPAVAGLLLAKEIETLDGILKTPEHPFCSLLGGAKVSDKVGMLKNIMHRVDCVLVGGGMAATFLKAEGYEIGKSLIEQDAVGTAADLLKLARENSVEVKLPLDVVVADDINSEARGEVVSSEEVPAGKIIADIGPKTVAAFQQELQNSKTVFWNGPLGVNEVAQFAEGTRTLAKSLAEMGATTVIGGGSTAEVVNEMGLADKMTFVSTGGGASLKFLGGETLPGIEVLTDKKS